jgi:hypothetical protein
MPRNAWCFVAAGICLSCDSSLNAAGKAYFMCRYKYLLQYYWC